ncbi:hypothetical protein ACFQY7_40925 [Actinomadura luteofluorescens]|uniref:ATP-dependent DNA ligase n=1 Tax=Actinomadura luteofluorescens TaxID=46163 RepID=UPI00362A44C8
MRINGPVAPMAATAIDHIPREKACSGGCRYEPKFDGFRCVARVSEEGDVQLWSRRLKRLDAAFPEIVSAVSATIPPGTVVDGEIVRWGGDGRLDFSALQRRHVTRRTGSPITEPCHYVVFDVLESGGTDHRSAPSPPAAPSWSASCTPCPARPASSSARSSATWARPACGSRSSSRRASRAWS